MKANDNYDPVTGLLTADMPTVKGPMGAVVMTLLGSLALLSVPVVAVGPRYAPELAPFAQTVGELGIGLDIVAIGGLLLLGLGRLARYQVLHARTLLEPGLIEHDLEQVDAGLREMQSRIKELRDEDTLLRQEMLAVSKLVSELRESTTRDAADAKNALFRLAASLDQLGEHVDQKVEASTIAVGERIFEATGIVEASRDYIHEGLEEAVRELGGYIFEAFEGEAAEGEALPANTPSALEPSQPSIAEPEPAHDDLQILVSLDAEEPVGAVELSLGLEAPLMDSPVAEPPAIETLGGAPLDQLLEPSLEPSSEPMAAAPLPAPEEAAPSGDGSGLGLLDELGDPELTAATLELPESPPDFATASIESPEAALPSASESPEVPEARVTAGGLILSPDHPRAPQATPDGISPDHLPEEGAAPSALSELRLLPPDELSHGLLRLPDPPGS